MMAYWYFPALAAVGLASLFIVILLDMLARALSLQALSLWVKSEYMQVGVTFIIILSAVALDTVGNSIVKNVTIEVAAAGGNTGLNYAATQYDDPFKIARSYLTDTVVDCQRVLYKRLYLTNLLVEPVSSLSLEVRSVEVMAGGFFLGGIVSSIKYIANNIVYMVVFEYAQYYILLFSQYTMLPIFLPLGLLMRAFPLTRGAGGLVTAFALGFAFVFPITYVLVIAAMPNANKGTCGANSVAPPADEFEQRCFYNAGEIEAQKAELNARRGEIERELNGFMGWISLLYLQAVLYPMISLIVTFTFIRQTSSLFGSDLAEVGRGLIKII